MKKLTILFLSLFLIGTTAEAQFLKKLQKKVEEKVEKKVIDNVSDKAAKETEKSLENMWSMDLGDLPVPMGGERVDPAEIPDSYTFDWEYIMDMKTSEGNMEMTYLLKKDAPHFGMKMSNVSDMLIVLDGEKDLSLIFMNSGGNKMLSATKNDPAQLEESEMDYPNEYSEIKEIGSKEILGYNCKGYQTETPEYIFTYYVTDEAGVSFTDIYQSNQKNSLKGFEKAWFDEANGLMMEMNMKDKKNPDKNVSMTCTSLEKKDFTVKKSDYQTF